MDLHKLRTFVTIAQEGNLTRASEALHLSQPAVSAQIKALEDELGLKLFHRLTRGMELTPAGKVLLEEAEKALMAARNVAARAQHLRSGISGEFRLGTISEPLILRLGEFLSALTSFTFSKAISFVHSCLCQRQTGDVALFIEFVGLFCCC